jgi:hypothetical protein
MVSPIVVPSEMRPSMAYCGPYFSKEPVKTLDAVDITENKCAHFEKACEFCNFKKRVL